MKRHTTTLLLSIGLAASSCKASAQGVILWNESASGELSQYYGSPTGLSPLVPGTNSVLGMTEVVPVGNNWLGYDDYFTITIPANLLVTAAYLSIDKLNVWTWIGDPTYLNQLGFIASPSSGSLLPQWGVASLGPGTYGVYLANNDLETSASAADYRLDFVAEPAPEPTGAALLVFGLGLLVVCRGRLVRKPQLNGTRHSAPLLP